MGAAGIASAAIEIAQPEPGDDRTPRPWRKIWVLDGSDRDRDHLLRQFLQLGLQALASASVPARPPFSPDLVVADPGPGGVLGCLTALRRSAPQASLILLTAFGSTAGAFAAGQEGATAYLTKPRTALQLMSLGAGQAATATPPQPPSLHRQEWEYVNDVLWLSAGNKSEAARRLRIHRSVLQRKLSRYPPTC
jgi:ActR/RegA family two-component response regulator